MRGPSIIGEVLAPGQAEAEALTLAEPLSFWGGFDLSSGRIIDRRHADHGRVCSGRIVLMRSGRGSSSGASVLAEAIRTSTAPAGLLLLERDPILAIGALVAAELYGLACPVVVVRASDWPRLTTAKRLRILAGESSARITFCAH